MSPEDAILIGVIAGALIVFAVSFVDRIKLDDPVGAISVHGICGMWGTIAVGIFGGASLLWQIIGTVSISAFAFVTSFDEVVVVIFVGSVGQKTLPWQMFTGLREQISPTILAAATVLVTISILLLITVELLRRRSERLRGMSQG